MPVSTKVNMGLRSRILGLRRRWHLIKFAWLESRSHRRLVVGSGCEAAVPVRGDGIGTLHIGRNNTLGFRAAFRLGSGEILLQARTADAVIEIGEGNWFSNNVAIVANERIVIGNGCQIGDMVTIYDSDFHELDPKTRIRSAGPSAPVVIGSNVWLGSRVMVLKGVSIGDNTVVGAMSLVTRSLPANCVAAGVPARVIRMLESK
jgi:acetyltransferase-like isoleucine patch superfamily enzyme